MTVRTRVLKFSVFLLGLYLLLVATVYLRQRSMLYFPTHHATTSEVMKPWLDGGRTIGFCREASNPRAIWLMTHGNAGQASDRAYVLGHISNEDSFYVLEYPGYGQREGSQSLEAMNQAASNAYRLLRSLHPHVPVCVVGESIGSGPACHLALENVPPDKVVLLVPFDSLASVAAERFFFLPVRFMLRDAWDNVASLKGYKGPVEIFGAASDAVIPIRHAKALARQVPGARFTEITGGHNDWSDNPLVNITP